MRRVVVDTNLWVSALLNRDGAPAQVRRSLEAGRFTLVMSQPLFTELGEVLSRTRLAYRFGITRSDITRLLVLLRAKADVVTVTGTVQLCRDPDDDLVIETALNGQADWLVTRDDDLKDVPELTAILAGRGVTVMSVRRFLVALADDAAG